MILITKQPYMQFVAVGTTATYTFDYSSTSEAQFQWYKNNVLLLGKTSQDLTYGPVTILDNNALFKCIVTTNTGESVVTDGARLVIDTFDISNFTHDSFTTINQSYEIQEGVAITHPTSVQFFKVFIPYGVTNVRVAAGNRQYIARFGKVPTLNSFGTGGPYTLQELRDSDLCGNAGIIVDEALASSTITNAWLYVALRQPYTGVTVHYTLDVYKYNSWYKNFKSWDFEGNPKAIQREFAGNTSGYTSVTSYYGPAPENNNEHNTWSFADGDLSNYTHIGYFRIFVPPGTQSIDVSEMLSDREHKCIARHKVPVKSSSYNDGTNDNFWTLAELEEADRVTVTNSYDTCNIVSEGYPNRLPVSSAGWLYVNSQSTSADLYKRRYSVMVHAPTYNAWFNTYIKDAEGWEKYIESVTTYVPQGDIPTPKPSDCVSITGHYDRAAGYNGSDRCTFANLEAYKEYTGDYVRMFIPPGTAHVDFTVLVGTDCTGLKSIGRHNETPVSITFSGDGFQSSLSDFEGNDLVSGTNIEGYHRPLSDSFESGLSADRAGWFYIKYNGLSSYSTAYLSVSFSVSVYVDIYNAWYDTYIKNEAGWTKLIENVATYETPEVPTKDLTIKNTASTDKTVTVKYPDGFVGSWSGGKLQAGASQPVTVSFYPTEEKDYKGTIDFTCDTGTLSVAVIGTGAVVHEDPVDKQIVVKNIHDKALDIGVTFPNGFTGDWDSVFLEAGASKILTVTFSPTQAKEYEGDIVFTFVGGEETVHVTGTGYDPNNPDPDDPDVPTINNLEELAEEYAKQAEEKGAALKQIKAQITKLESMKSVIESVNTSNESAQLFMKFNIDKIAGAYGTYGLDSQISKLGDIETALTNDVSFYTTAAKLYSALSADNDPGEVDAPPGYYSGTDSASDDKDNPISKEQLKAKADYHLQNRKEGTNTGYFPDNSKVGDLIFFNGRLLSYYEPGAYDFQNTAEEETLRGWHKVNYNKYIPPEPESPTT